jgi:hypothetical protein
VGKCSYSGGTREGEGEEGRARRSGKGRGRDRGRERRDGRWDGETEGGRERCAACVVVSRVAKARLTDSLSSIQALHGARGTRQPRRHAADARRGRGNGQHPEPCTASPAPLLLVLLHHRAVLASSTNVCHRAVLASPAAAPRLCACIAHWRMV